LGIGIGAWLKDSIDKARTARNEWAEFDVVLKDHSGNLETGKKEVL
jgi:hypothetical protein